MKINETNVTNNLHKFNEIYKDGKEDNKIPENTPVIIYCSNDKDVSGWLAVDDKYELGIELLIAKSWITQKEFLSW